ncbi:MAG: molybdopterin molybdotransferase MoeA [Nitrospinae bacterium]|nr:molybdopterin molybdotransferase MoeA [Nitrospinota bacterium]
MISIEEALEIILSQITPLGAEVVPVASASGRVLEKDMVSGLGLPPFDQSAMDGFALRFEDVQGASPQSPKSLRVIGEQPAGKNLNLALKEGEAARIMTGAMMPSGADTVIQVEDTDGYGGETAAILKSPAGKGANIRYKGEYIKKGETVLRRGTHIGPQQVGLLSSLCLAAIPVYARPTVAILATGDEIVDVGETPTECQIINSNSHLLSAMVAECGGRPELLGIARDVEAAIEAKLLAGSRSDILITTGGVSVGNYDLVKAVLERLGSELTFWKVAMKPGKPLVFGRLNGKLFFGLPGNPVASFIAFHEFVQPAIKKLGGFLHYRNAHIQARLDTELHRKVDARRIFIASVIHEENGEFIATPLPDQGSGNLKLICDCNGFIILSNEKSFFKKGEMVTGFLL